MNSQKLFFIAMVLVLFSFWQIGTASAGAEKTPETCLAVGAVLVKCYECRSGQEEYKGDVAILAEYEEFNGGKYCVPTESTHQRCKSKFSIINVGFYAKYKWFGGSRKEFSKASCVNKVGY